MADITVRTQQLDRDELQKFIPVGNFRLIKAFENLMEDVAITIPDAIGTAVTGPTTTGDGDLALFDGTDGQKLKDGGVNITAVALLDSPVFVGNPRAPTPAPGDNDFSIATTAFVQDLGAGKVDGPAISTNNGVALFNGATGKVIKDSGVQISALATNASVAATYAPLASPALTGNPTAPTPSPGDNDTSIATTAFVTAAVIAGSGRLLNTQSFTSSGTYTPTSGTTRIIVEVLGGGGGGGGVAATAASQTCVSGGGGSGGYVKTYLASGFSGAAVTIGALGAGGSAGAAGSAGGASSFLTCSAGGGGGGGLGFVSSVSSAGNGSGGTASGGTIANTPGGQGGLPYGSNAAGLSNGGCGGSSPYGQGGQGGGALTTNTSIGAVGTGRGSGGGGSAAGASQGVNLGANGTAGLVIIYEYS